MAKENVSLEFSLKKSGTKVYILIEINHNELMNE